MLTQQTILEAAQRAAMAASCPARVMLFGSYARGDANENSDLDLLVIEHNVPDKAAEYLKLHRAIGPMGVGVDVLVISSAKFERRCQVPGTVAYRPASAGGCARTDLWTGCWVTGIPTPTESVARRVAVIRHRTQRASSLPTGSGPRLHRRTDNASCR